MTNYATDSVVDAPPSLSGELGQNALIFDDKRIRNVGPLVERRSITTVGVIKLAHATHLLKDLHGYNLLLARITDSSDTLLLNN